MKYLALTVYTVAIIVATGYVYEINKKDYEFIIGPNVISANATGTSTLFMSCSKGMGIKYLLPF